MAKPRLRDCDIKCFPLVSRSPSSHVGTMSTVLSTQQSSAREAHLHLTQWSPCCNLAQPDGTRSPGVTVTQTKELCLLCIHWSLCVNITSFRKIEFCFPHSLLYSFFSFWSEQTKGNFSLGSRIRKPQRELEMEKKRADGGDKLKSHWVS